MNILKALTTGLFITVLLTGMTACSPDVGSEAWCKQMDKKSKGDWSSNELGNYTRHCVFR